MGYIKIRKEKNRFITITAWLFVIGAFLAAWCLFLDYNRYEKTAENVEYIARHINKKNEIIDWSNEIECRTVDDVKLFMGEKEIQVQYGKILLSWRKKDFMSNKVQDQLKSIMLTSRTDKETGYLTLYWKKTNKVERWVK